MRQRTDNGIPIPIRLALILLLPLAPLFALIFLMPFILAPIGIVVLRQLMNAFALLVEVIEGTELSVLALGHDT